MTHILGGERSYYLRHYDALRTKTDMRLIRKTDSPINNNLTFFLISNIQTKFDI